MLVRDLVKKIDELKSDIHIVDNDLHSNKLQDYYNFSDINSYIQSNNELQMLLETEIKYIVKSISK
jgi:hypothetical protein